MQKPPPTCNGSNHDHTPLPTITHRCSLKSLPHRHTAKARRAYRRMSNASVHAALHLNSRQPCCLVPHKNRAMRLTQQRRHLKTAQALKCSGPGTSSCLKSQPAPFWQPLSFRGFCSTKSQSQNKHEHRLQHRQPRLSPPMTACAAGAATLATSVTSGQVAWSA